MDQKRRFRYLGGEKTDSEVRSGKRLGRRNLLLLTLGDDQVRIPKSMGGYGGRDGIERDLALLGKLRSGADNEHPESRGGILQSISW